MAAHSDDLFDAPVHLCERVARNVTSRRQSVDLFADLADDAADSRAAIAAEMRTRPRSAEAIINRPFDTGYGVVGVPGVARRWSGTRFSDGGFGVWYGSRTRETTIAETTYHFARELTGRGLAAHDRPIDRHRAVYTAMLDALLFDLRAKVDAHPGLVDPDNYDYTQRVGRAVHDGGHPGLVTRSARAADGDNVAVFSPRYLSDARLQCYLTYRYRPAARRVDVYRQPDVFLGTYWQA